MRAASLPSFPLSSPKPPGLYRQHFTAAEIKMLDSSPADDARSEIRLVRGLLARLLAAAHRRGRRTSLADRAAMLSAVAAAGLTMAALARYQDKVHGAGALGGLWLETLAQLDPDDL